MDLNEQLQNNTFFLQNNEAINSVLQISNLNGISNSEIEQNFLVSSIETSKHEQKYSSPEIPFVIRLQSPNLNCQTFPQTTTFFVKQIEESYPSEAIQCEGCGMEILERHLFCLSKNNEHLIENEKNNQKEKSFWHENCLRCVKCNKNVGNDNTRCFVHDGRIFCSEDYSMLFGPTAHAPCTRCGQSIPPTELVYRSAGIYVYHLHCFVCFCCGQQLRLGEEYINVEGQLICQREVNLWRLQQPQIPTNFLQIPPFPELEFNLQSQGYSRRRHRDRSKKIPKRPRTILNAPQRKAFKYAFEKGQKPTRKAREQLARETGLSVRVVQVWFQNQRAKMKKESNKREVDKPQNVEGSLENNGKERQMQSGSSAEEEIMGEDDSDEFDADSLDDEEDDGEEKEIININGNLTSSQKKQAEENNQVEGQQNPIEKLYNMHQTYFAFA